MNGYMHSRKEIAKLVQENKNEDAIEKLEDNKGILESRQNVYKKVNSAVSTATSIVTIKDSMHRFQEVTVFSLMHFIDELVDRYYTQKEANHSAGFDYLNNERLARICFMTHSEYVALAQTTKKRPLLLLIFIAFSVITVCYYLWVLLRNLFETTCKDYPSYQEVCRDIKKIEGQLNSTRIDMERMNNGFILNNFYLPNIPIRESIGQIVQYVTPSKEQKPVEHVEQKREATKEPERRELFEPVNVPVPVNAPIAESTISQRVAERHAKKRHQALQNHSAFQ